MPAHETFTFFACLGGLAFLIWLLTIIASVIQRTKPKDAILGATALSAIITAIAAIISGWIFQGQLNEMRLDKRAWIFAENIWLSDNVIIDRNMISVSLMFHLKNVGHSPALHVIPAAKTFLTGISINNASSEVCKDAENDLTVVLSSMFPGNETDQGISAYTKDGELDVVREYADKFGGGKYAVAPQIIACIAYRLSPNGEFHHTPVGFFLQRQDGQAFATGDFPIKPSDVILIRNPIDVGPAD